MTLEYLWCLCEDAFAEEYLLCLRQDSHEVSIENADVKYLGVGFIAEYLLQIYFAITI